MITIDWKPDKEDRTPIYRQIVKYISDKIAAGDWVIGQPAAVTAGHGGGLRRQSQHRGHGHGGTDLLWYPGERLRRRHRVASNTWSLLMSQPPDWNKYIQSGPFKANHSAIQTINKMEFEPGYIRIGTGELSPELYPSKVIAKLFQKMPERIPHLGYLGPLGLPELGRELSSYLKRSQGIEADPANILVVSGSLQGLQLISVCMLKRGSHVYTEAPTYLKSLQVFQSAGMQMHGVPMDREGIKYWNIKDGSASLLYTIPTFHNPTGLVISESRRRELLGFCQNQRLPVLEDDAYGQLWFDEQPPRSLKARDKTGSVIYMGTVSKTMAPGLRIGWVVGPEAVVQRLGDVKMPDRLRRQLRVPVDHDRASRQRGIRRVYSGTAQRAEGTEGQRFVRPGKKLCPYGRLERACRRLLHLAQVQKKSTGGQGLCRSPEGRHSVKSGQRLRLYGKQRHPAFLRLCRSRRSGKGAGDPGGNHREISEEVTMIKETNLQIRNSTIDFLVFTKDAGEDSIEVRVQDGDVWLTQKAIAQLFDVDRSAVTKHLKNIFESGELDVDSVCAVFAQTADDGKTYQYKHYALPAIIAVGYRTNSRQAAQFRQWATRVLDAFAKRGYVLDKNRLMNGQIFDEDYFEHLISEIQEIRASERRFIPEDN